MSMFFGGGELSERADDGRRRGEAPRERDELDERGRFAPREAADAGRGEMESDAEACGLSCAERLAADFDDGDEALVGILEDRERLEGLVEGVNPGYDPFDQGNIRSWNCGSCALATELRLTGENPDAVAEPRIIGTADEMERITGREQVAMTPAEIEDYAFDQGPGFHTIMGIDYVGGDGHWLNLATTETGVYVLDGQCGRVWTFGDYADEVGPQVRSWDIGIERGRAPRNGGWR